MKIKKLGVCLYYIGNNMETSGLLLVSVFCNIQRTPQFGEQRYDNFLNIQWLTMRILCELELFTLNSTSYKQISNKKFGDSDKKAYLSRRRILFTIKYYHYEQDFNDSIHVFLYFDSASRTKERESNSVD